MAARRIAIVGGCPGRIQVRMVGTEVVYFGSAQDGGGGELKRLKATLHGGRLDLVVFMVRFCGHSMQQSAAQEARRAGVAVFIWHNGVSGLQAALRVRDIALVQ